MTRSSIGKLPGLTWPQTCVVKAACDVAVLSEDRRLTVNQIAASLALKGMARELVFDALDTLDACGYFRVDDVPESAHVVIHITPKCLEEYAYHFVQGYGAITHRIWSLVCSGPEIDAIGLANASGHSALLVEHILDKAAEAGFLRLSKNGYSVVVREVKPQLRRLVSGVA